MTSRLGILRSFSIVMIYYCMSQMAKLQQFQLSVIRRIFFSFSRANKVSSCFLWSGKTLRFSQFILQGCRFNGVSTLRETFHCRTRFQPSCFASSPLPAVRQQFADTTGSTASRQQQNTHMHTQTHTRAVACHIKIFYKKFFF